jgi:hypothetical protein
VQLFGAATAVTVVLTVLTAAAHDAADAAMIVGTMTLVALPYVLWRAGRRVRRHWNAFEAAIGPTTVRVAAKGTGRDRRSSTIRSPRSSSGQGGLLVQSVEAGVSVRVPRTIEATRTRALASPPCGPSRSAARASLTSWASSPRASSSTVRRYENRAGAGHRDRALPGAGAVFVAWELRTNPLIAPGRRRPASPSAIGTAVAREWRSVPALLRIFRRRRLALGACRREDDAIDVAARAAREPTRARGAASRADTPPATRVARLFRDRLVVPVFAGLGFAGGPARHDQRDLAERPRALVARRERAQRVRARPPRAPW